jgi:hypothetical protein
MHSLKLVPTPKFWLFIMSFKWILIFIVGILLILGYAIYYLFDYGVATELPSAEQKKTSFKEKSKSNSSFNKKQKNESTEKNIKYADEEKSSTEKLNASKENNVKINELEKKANEIIPSEKSNIISFPIIVKNEAGELLENAQLDLFEYYSEKLLHSSKTDKEGKVNLLINSLKSNRIFSLKTSHKNYASKIYFYFNPKQYSSSGPLIIILLKGTTIKGVARDSNGVLLEGIEINLQTRNVYYGYNFTISTTKSKANGIFEFANVAPARISFSALGQNYILTDSKIYTVPNKENIILTFQKARKRLLKVTNTDGIGIAKAKVVYFLGAQNLKEPTKTETDANGFCHLFLSKERAKNLIINHSDYITYDTSNIYSSQETEPESVALMKGNKLSVQIKDKKTGQIIKNATVSCVNDKEAFELIEIKEPGTYEFETLAEDEYFISVQCSGYNSIDRYPIAIKTEAKTMKTFELEPAKHLNIKLIDGTTKSPLINKPFYNLNDWQKGDPLHTNQFGESSLPINTHYNNSRINIQVEGYANVDQAVSATEETTTIELFPSATLFVFIIDSLNQPLDEISLWCEYNVKKSNEKGTLNLIYNSEKHCFVVNGLTIGKAELTFQSLASKSIDVSIDLVAGNDNKLDLTLKPIELLICNVRSSDSQINLSELTGKIEFHTSNYSGYYYEDQYLEYNEETKYFTSPIFYEFNNSFTIKFPQHLPSAKTVIQPASEAPKVYEFILSKGLGIEGEIVDNKGKLIIDAKIEFEPVNRETGERDWASTDEYGNAVSSKSIDIKNENGKFSIYGNVAGKYKIKVTHFDYISYEEEIELTNRSKIDLHIILKKGLQISGTIKDLNEKLVAGAKLKLALKEKGEFYTGTNFKGEFIFKNMRPGSYLLSCSSLSGYIEKFEVNVNEGQDLKDLSITLEENLEISGIVCDEQGNKISKITVTIYSPVSNQSKSFNQATDETGSFKFSNTTKNKYSVSIYSNEGYILDPATVTLTGGDVDVKLIVKMPNRKLINGRVFTPDGKECTNYRLSIIDIDSKNKRYFIDSKITNAGYQGYINLEGIQTVKIIAQASGFSQGESEPFNLHQYADQPIVITLKNKIIIELKIVDLFSRLPISKAFASISSSYNTNEWWFNENLCSDDKGLLRLDDGLTLGKGILTVKAAGYIDTYVEVDVAEKNNLTEVALGKGGIIKGQILDTENKPIPFISVRAEPLIAKEITNNNYFNGQRNSNEIKATSDENGFYEIKLVPPGEYFVWTKSASRLQPKNFFPGLLLSIEEGKEINLTKEDLIAFTKTAKINITLTGKDIAEIPIKISKANPTGKSNITHLEVNSDQEGKAQFTEIPLGEYIVTVNGLTKPISQPVLVTNGSEINLEIAGE